MDVRPGHYAPDPGFDGLHHRGPGRLEETGTVRCETGLNVLCVWGKSMKFMSK